VSWTCPACKTAWSTTAALVDAFNAMVETVMNRQLWPRPVTRAEDVLCCPRCLTERT